MFCCSCVRAESLRTQAIAAVRPLLEEIRAPRAGDLIMVEVLAVHGAYQSVEDEHGQDRALRLGERFIGVLAERRSGTNITGRIPLGPLRRDDRVELLAKGGIIGNAVFVPRYYGGSALPLRVLGFPSEMGAQPLNIANSQPTPLPGVPRRPDKILFVAGTSAETGKTTAMVSLLAALQRWRGDIRSGAVKACGTGRLVDRLRYTAAGAHCALDFVDAGLATTYGTARETFIAMFERIIAATDAVSDLVLVELGGDLLEAGAPYALERISQWQAPLLLVVNDALGALASLDLLHKVGIETIQVATLRQNPWAMARRLGLSKVFDPADENDLFAALLETFPDLITFGR
jgi:hypothetical protein